MWTKVTGVVVNLHPTSLPSLTGTALKKSDIPRCPNGSVALGNDERVVVKSVHPLSLLASIVFLPM